MYCNDCGAKLESDASDFCSACGANQYPILRWSPKAAICTATPALPAPIAGPRGGRRRNRLPRRRRRREPRRRSRFEFGASHSRALAGAESAFGVGEARRAIGRRIVADTPGSNNTFGRLATK